MLSLACGTLNRLVKQQWDSGCQWLRVCGKQGHEVQSFSYVRRISSGDLMYNGMAVVNNAELYTWNLIKAKILGVCIMKKEITVWDNWYAAAKSLQSCPTLCDPIDSSPPGSPVPGILQARTLEWGCHFLLQCMKVKSESEVTQSYPTLCDPMDCSLPGSSIHGCNPMNHSMPGFPVHHQLLEFTQTHVHWISDAIQPSHPLLYPSPALNLSQHQGRFKWVSSSHQVAKLLEFQL